jgi:hypothetical protein
MAFFIVIAMKRKVDDRIRRKTHPGYAVYYSTQQLSYVLYKAQYMRR